MEYRANHRRRPGGRDLLLLLNGPNLNLLGTREPEIYGREMLADAISGVELPAIEVHVSNVHKRDAFRHHSYICPEACSIIIGSGVNGYRLAVEQIAHLLGK